MYKKGSDSMKEAVWGFKFVSKAGKEFAGRYLSGHPIWGDYICPDKNKFGTIYNYMVHGLGCLIQQKDFIVKRIL